MMCRRHDQRLDEKYFAHFYQLVIRGLEGSDLAVIFAIINNATRLFGLQLPGCNILIAPFLRCFRQLYFGNSRGSPFAAAEMPPRASDSSQSVPEIVRQNVAIIEDIAALSAKIHCPSMLHFVMHSIDLMITCLCG